MPYGRKDIFFLLFRTSFLRFFAVPTIRIAVYNALGGFSLSLTA